MVTLVPETVHTVPVELAKVTVVPAVSEAVPWEGPRPTHDPGLGPGGVQVMVWTPGFMVILTGLSSGEQVTTPGGCRRGDGYRFPVATS